MATVLGAEAVYSAALRIVDSAFRSDGIRPRPAGPSGDPTYTATLLSLSMAFPCAHRRAASRRSCVPF